MKPRGTIRNRGKEAGIALLISIFVLLLISVVAIAMVVSSGTESALAGNYRSSTGVYYAALAGLEEARGRLLFKNPQAFSTTNPSNFLPPAGTPLPIGNAYYLINPLGAETVAPWDPASTYPDNEFQSEFSSSGFPAPANPRSALSVWASGPLSALSFPGPLYKWVRLNAVSEKSLNIDVDGDNQADSVTALYYDGAHFSNNSSVGPQVLEITSFATLPNGSQKLLQYLVTPVSLILSFPSALTLDGPITGGGFSSSFNSDFYVSGIDRQNGSPYPSTCPAPDPTRYAIGATSTSDANQVVAGIPPLSSGAYLYSNYRGILPYPSVGNVSGSLMPALQTVNSLDGPQGVVQMISTAAGQHISGPTTGLPDYGALNRLVTTVVLGNLTLPNTADGYGLLLVTGDLTLDGSASWHGVILVIGTGNLYMNTYGGGEIDGAVLLANTRHADGSLRTNLGNVRFDISNPNYGNSGFWYNSCWVQAVMPSGYYKILSFHEISQ